MYSALWPIKPSFISCLPPHYCTFRHPMFYRWPSALSVSLPRSSFQTHTRQQAARAASPPLWRRCLRRHQAVRPPAPRAPGARWAPWRSGSRTLSANSAPGPQLKGNVRSANLRESLHLFRPKATARIWAARPGLMTLSPSCPSPTENWWVVKPCNKNGLLFISRSQHG